MDILLTLEHLHVCNYGEKLFYLQWELFAYSWASLLTVQSGAY